MISIIMYGGITMKNYTCSVVVVGAGPAGLAAAISAKKNGAENQKAVKSIFINTFHIIFSFSLKFSFCIFQACIQRILVAFA